MDYKDKYLSQKAIADYVNNTVTKSMAEGEKGCIVHSMNSLSRIPLEESGCTIIEEVEDDNVYYWISW